MSSVSCGLVGFSCIICRLSRSRRTRYGHKKLIREKIRESHKEKTRLHLPFRCNYTSKGQSGILRVAEEPDHNSVVV